MGPLRSLSQSWFSAGLILCLTLSGAFYLSEALSADLYETSGRGWTIFWMTAIFVLPSTVLNWLYDKQEHLKTQRDWMMSPKGLFGKAGYILMGSVALWTLLCIAIILGGLVMGGLFSLGQAAWST